MDFFTTLLVTKIGGPEALGPCIFKSWGTGPTGPIGWLRQWRMACQQDRAYGLYNARLRFQREPW